MIRTAAAAVFASLLLSSAALAAQAIPPAVAAAVSDAGRPAADTARDANRKPGPIVAFSGVKPGDKVAELIPGSGYYTRILAKTVGPGGKVYALVPAAMAARPGGLDALNALIKTYPNVQIVSIDPTNFTLPEKVDLFWTTENYHDMHNGPTANIGGFNKSVFESLKPGGIFFVEDHNAKAGSPADVTSTLHRIEVATARRELQAAGFRIDGESDLLKNPADPGDTTNRDAAVQGHTDRFALRLRRPG